MALGRIKIEHAGAKNGGGAWMTRYEAKRAAKKRRRRDDLDVKLSSPRDRGKEQP